MFLARPLAVWVSTLGQGFGRRERVLIGWAGLRGAVPIVLATFPLSERVEESETIFNAVFFVVVISALLQGPTLAPLARRLGLATRAGPVHQPPLEVGAIEALGAELLEFEVEPGDAVAGTHVRELQLPRDALIAVLLRGDQALPPRGSTVIQPGDRLYVLARARSRAAVERLFDEWSEPGARAR